MAEVLLNAVGRAIKASGTSKLDLRDELDIGTTTIWRACKGLPVDANSAKALHARFKELDPWTLTAEGYKDFEPAAEAPDSSDSGQHEATNPDSEQSEPAA